MIINEELIYDKPKAEDYSQLTTESKKVLEWVEEGKTILEVGCHTGYLSQWLKNANCSVTGVDINSKALDVSAPFVVESIHADIETEEFWNRLEGKTFNTITCMHVLEHLSNPWVVLEKLVAHLEKEGEIIIALPNINNARDRYDIFFGGFNYTIDGVMDKTHLRFFNKITATEMIEATNLNIIDYYSPWQANPFHYFIDHIPVLCKMRNLFKPNKVPFAFRSKQNLTDVVMMFKCKRK